MASEGLQVGIKAWKNKILLSPLLRYFYGCP